MTDKELRAKAGFVPWSKVPKDARVSLEVIHDVRILSLPISRAETKKFKAALSRTSERRAGYWLRLDSGQMVRVVKLEDPLLSTRERVFRVAQETSRQPITKA